MDKFTLFLILTCLAIICAGVGLTAAMGFWPFSVGIAMMVSTTILMTERENCLLRRELNRLLEINMDLRLAQAKTFSEDEAMVEVIEEQQT